MTKTSGSTGKQDVLVTISDNNHPLKINITSPVEDLFGRAIRETVNRELSILQVTTGNVSIDDNQALNFVLKARIRAAIEALRNDGALI